MLGTDLASWAKNAVKVLFKNSDGKENEIKTNQKLDKIKMIYDLGSIRKELSPNMRPYDEVKKYKSKIFY